MEIYPFTRYEPKECEGEPGPNVPVCPHCGEEIFDSDEYCMSCGCDLNYVAVIDEGRLLEDDC